MYDVGKRIKETRTAKGVTLEELAKRVGCTWQSIQKYERGIVTNIPLDKIDAIAKALDVAPGYLMGWENEILVEREQPKSDKNLEERLLAYSKLLTKAEQRFIDAYRNANQDAQMEAFMILSEGKKDGKQI